MKCPFCGGKLHGAAAKPPLPKRKMLIYDAVVAAGADGVDKTDLLKIMMDGKPISKGGAIMLRVQIHDLNKIVAPLKQRIVGMRGVGYILTSVKNH